MSFEEWYAQTFPNRNSSCTMDQSFKQDIEMTWYAAQRQIRDKICSISDETCDNFIHTYMSYT